MGDTASPGRAPSRQVTSVPSLGLAHQANPCSRGGWREPRSSCERKAGRRALPFLMVKSPWELARVCRSHRLRMRKWDSSVLGATERPAAGFKFCYRGPTTWITHVLMGLVNQVFWGEGIVLLRKNFLHFSLFGLTEDFLLRFLSCAL